MTASTKTSWSAEEARKFLAEAATDRLHAAWLMAMYGGRREEICGARWERTLTSGHADVDHCHRARRGGREGHHQGGAEVRAQRPDAAAARRPGGCARRAAQGQAREKLAAGEAYRASGYVVSDELGEAVNPEWVSDEFGRVRERAGLRRITLHEARHTASSLMEKAGVPDSIRAAWCGHTVEVNKATYVHALPEDLAAARDALSHVYGATGS